MEKNSSTGAKTVPKRGGAVPKLQKKSNNSHQNSPFLSGHRKPIDKVPVYKKFLQYKACWRPGKRRWA